MLQNLDAVRPICIAAPKDWSVVYVVVQGAAIVRLGDDANQLVNSATDGIPITAATPAQQSFVWWKGKLFAIANAGCVVSVLQPGQNPQRSS